MGTTSFGPIPAPNNDELRSDGAAAMRSIAKAVDDNYLKKTGDAATGPLSYADAADVADFNDNLSIPSAGQVRFYGTANFVPRANRPFITRSNQSPTGDGWRGQPGATTDLRYIIYNYSTGELLWSSTAFPQTRMAPAGSPEAASTRASSTPQMPTVREFTEDGQTHLGFALDDIPDPVLSKDDDGNTLGFDIIKMAMLGFADLAALQKKVAALEARLAALE